MKISTVFFTLLVFTLILDLARADDETLGLPFKAVTNIPTSGDSNVPAAAFEISNEGSGGVAAFTTKNPTASDEPVLRVHTDGKNSALDVKTTGRGSGAVFSTESSSSRAHTVEIKTDAAAAGLRVETSGFGTGVEAVSSGSGPAANIRIDNPASQAAALEVSTDGKGPAASFEGKVLLNGQVLLDVPVGAVLPFFGDMSSLPDGWLPCDGRTVSDSASPLNGKQLPDLSGMFLRGAGNGVQAGRTGGRDKYRGHTHSIALEDEPVWMAQQIHGHRGYTSYVRSLNHKGHIHNNDPNDSGFGVKWSGDEGNNRLLIVEHRSDPPYESHQHVGASADVYGHTNSGGSFDNRPRFFTLNMICRVK